MAIKGKSKNFDYFDAFSKIAKYASAAANYLHSSLTDFHYDGFLDRATELHRIENAADSQKHEITEHLAHEFITPIELEDIVALSQELDNVVDSLDDVMRRVYMFDIKAIRPEMLEFTALVCESCSKLEAAATEFRSFKSSKILLNLIIEVNTLENKGDALHSKYMHKLFVEEKNDRTVLIWTTMFEAMEQCFDACEHAVDIIESVIMKNT